MFFSICSIAITAAILGIGGTARGATEVAKILFLISAVLLLVASLIGRKTPVT